MTDDSDLQAVPTRAYRTTDTPARAYWACSLETGEEAVVVVGPPKRGTS